MNDEPDGLDLTAMPSTEAAPGSSDDGQQIGPYRLLQKLGEGGMGEVWLAEQTEPVKRKVALKVIKQGMDTKQVVARFEAERQALAMMDHPAVAKVFDAGATSTGRPYFAMEYVKGVPITEHCDRHRLSNPERLELFRQVCEGVQHAHQKAIIHRDLKPSNVLVTEQDGRRLPKIIDFGVAKATAQKLTEKTMFTQLGVLIGTPEYMSPEQAELTGEDVDTRTDVYSLGVILYELLIGALPFDPKELRSGGFEGIRKKIREEEPHKPSTRLGTLGDQSTESAKCRRVDLLTLQRQLRGDLDWITMRALEKDRARRYGSPMELAADIERHLKHEPVLASPPSALYRARKFVRRHTTGVVAAAAAVLVLVAFAGTMAVQANRIAAERDRANAEAVRANREAEAKGQVSEFLKDLFTVSDPGEARGNSITARELLDKGAKKIEQLEDEQTRAELMATMGHVYLRLGLTAEARPLVERAVAEHKRLLGMEDPGTLRSMNFLAMLYGAQARNDEAEPLYAEILERSKRLHGDDHRFTLSIMDNLALVYRGQDRADEAEALHVQAFESRKRMLGEDHPDTISSMDFLALCYQHQRRYDEAERLYLEAIDARKRVEGDDHFRMFDSMNNLATMYLAQGRIEEAEALSLETLEGRRRIFEDDHPATLDSMNNLAAVYAKQGRYAEAERLYFETLEARRRVLGNDHPRMLRSVGRLAGVYKAQGRHDEAERLYIERLETQKDVLGDEHRNTLSSMFRLAEFLRQQKRYEEADVLLHETIATQRRVLGDDHEDTLRSQMQLAISYQKQKRYTNAEPLLLETIEARRRIGAAEGALYSMKWLVDNYRKQERYADARTVYDDMLETERRTLGEEDPATLRSMRDLAEAIGKRGDYVEAEALLRRVLEVTRRVLGEEHRDTLFTMEDLAVSIGFQGRIDEAEPLLLANLEAKRRVFGDSHSATALTLYNLACVEGVRGNRAEAMDWLRRSVDAGWADAELMTRDSSLESVHGSEFDALVERTRRNASDQHATR